jgi:hypothetical protein
MPSPEETAAKLEDLINRAVDLPCIRHDGEEWAIWKDEVKHYLCHTLGNSAEDEFSNAMRVTVLPAYGGDYQPYYVKALDRAVTCLKVIKARVERGYYDAALSGKEAAAPLQSSPRPSIFIAHSGEPPALLRLTRFLEALGVQPVIAEWLPFRGRTVPEHVRSVMNGCQAAIVFATASDQVGQRFQPGRGALIETGILQEHFADRVIYLVEEGAEFGPMADNFACESFTQDCLERAFHRIVLELRAHGIVWQS